MLGNTIILAVKDFDKYVITAVIFKCMANYLPRVAFVVVEEAFYIFKYKNFGLAFLYYARELTEKCTSCIFKTFSLADH